MTDQKNRAVFLDRDGVINVERSYIREPADMELYPFTAKAIKMINQMGYLAIVVTNQSMIAQGMCTFETLEKVHDKMLEDLANEGAKIDDIFFCPHYPEIKTANAIPELSIHCDCRKPKPGLILKAGQKYHIDLKASYMIGDTRRDIQAGKSVGCITIGVKTGHGVQENDGADFSCENLLEAIEIIQNHPSN